jgi:hypothetical protein
MSSGLRIDGVRQLEDLLRRLPDTLRADARAIVLGAAKNMEADIANDYAAHTHKGALRRGVQVLTDDTATRFGARATVRNRARHASLFEKGTARRHYSGTDKRGRRYVNADRGAMPAAKVFIPSAQRHRGRMYARLVAMLRAFGFQVTGA